jgi:hypothetical protein
VFLILRVVHLDEQNNDLRGKTAELSEQLKSQTVITKEKIVYKYRDSEGKPKEQSIYIPSEGSVNIITPKDNETVKPSTLDNFFNTTIEHTDGSIIMIQNKGFCIAPEVGVFISKETEVALQVRLLYWNRYNAGIGFGHKDTLFIYGSRSISDILSFTRNTSLQIGVGKNLKEQDTRFLVGIGVRL